MVSFSLVLGLLTTAARFAYAAPFESGVRNQTVGCQLLASAYPNLTWFPESAEYEARIVENWSETCVERSTCVFEPRQASEVAEAVKLLVKSNTQFAVRGGGHMPNPGAAGIEKGVLISMNYMNSTELSPDQSVAKLGPGMRWGAVYDWISTYKLAVIGGRYGPVGVPGLLLGGGISYFGSQYGWASNMLVNVQLVLANGSIVDVNATSNSDLFWALKGGSSNFGIATRFDVKTIPFSNIYGGFTVYNKSALDEFIEATAHYCIPSGGSSDVRTSVNPSMTYSVAQGDLQLYSIISHIGDDASPASVANYTKLPHISSDNSVRTRLNMFTNETAGPIYMDRSSRQVFRATSLKADPQSVYLTNKTFFSVIESMPALKNVTGLRLTATHQTITSEWLQRARDSGGDPMDLDPADGNFVEYLIGCAWEDAKDDDLVHQFSDACVAEIEHQSKAAGLYYDFYYLNDSPEQVRVFDSYGSGGSSLRRMRSIAKAYDPTGVFQTLLPGGFKLFY